MLSRSSVRDSGKREIRWDMREREREKDRDD
jgi:hypothetical protein